MHNTPTHQDLLDERSDLIRAVDAVLHTEAADLETVTLEVPGAYALLYQGTLHCYARLSRRAEPVDRRSIIEAGGYPLYVGSAADLKARARRHLLNLRHTPNIGARDLLMVTLPVRTFAGALYVEAALIAALQPVWNQPWLQGFGSQPQGSARARYQRVPPWNILHPGRSFSPDAPRPDVTSGELATQVEEHLARTVPAACALVPPVHQRRLYVLGR